MGASQSHNPDVLSSPSSSASPPVAEGRGPNERASSLLFRLLHNHPSFTRGTNMNAIDQMDFSVDPHLVLDVPGTDETWTSRKMTPTKKSRQLAQECMRNMPQVTLQQDARNLLRPQSYCEHNDSEEETRKKQDAEDDLDLSCLICFYDYRKGDTLTSLPCGHSYHSKCLEEWFSRRLQCPYCRSELPSSYRRKQHQCVMKNLPASRQEPLGYCPTGRRKSPLLVDKLRQCQLRQNYQYHRRTVLQQLSFVSVATGTGSCSNGCLGETSSTICSSMCKVPCHDDPNRSVLASE